MRRKYHWEDAAPESPSRTDPAVKRSNVIGALNEVQSKLHRYRVDTIARFVAQRLKEKEGK